MNELTEKLKILGSKIEAVLAKLSSQREEIKQLKTEKQALVEQTANLETELKISQEKVTELKSQASDLKDEHQKFGSSVDEMVKNLNEEPANNNAALGGQTSQNNFAMSSSDEPTLNTPIVENHSQNTSTNTNATAENNSKDTAVLAESETVDTAIASGTMNSQASTTDTTQPAESAEEEQDKNTNIDDFWSESSMEER